MTIHFRLPNIFRVIASTLITSAAIAIPAIAQDLKFSIPLPLSGPFAVTGQAQQVGWQHAVDYINKNGGVKGRKIETSFYDDEYKVELGVAGFKKAAADGDLVFASGDGTPFVRAIKFLCQAQELPRTSSMCPSTNIIFWLAQRIQTWLDYT